MLENISNLILRQEEVSFDEKKIVENSLSLWIALVLHQTNLIKNFYEFSSEFKAKEKKSFLISGLTMKANKKIREEFYNALTIFAKV